MPPEWEIWLDVNLSPAIAKWMKEFAGMQVKSSYVLSLQARYIKRAKENGHVILISKDTDFSELISRLGSPPKLINIRKGNRDNRVLWNLRKPKIMEMIISLTASETDIVEFG